MTEALEQILPGLGARIEKAWSECEYNYGAFPEIACAALRELPDLRSFGEGPLRRWLLSVPRLPDQLDPHAKFGNPPITLFHGGRFVIDVYCWLDPALGIHDHAFCGAFAVVSGSTVQITYRFTEQERAGLALAVGDLEPVSVEALPPGAVVPIPAGRDFIHTTWHLARPTLTLCVRTVGPPDDAPQAVYFPPHLRVGITPRPLTGRYLSYMSFEKEANGGEALDSFTTSLLGGGDTLLAFECLQKYASLTEEWAEVERMLERVPRLPPDTRDALFRTIRHLHRGLWHYDFGAAQTEGERLLLGLLTTFPNREPILRAVRRIRPGEDADGLVTEWVLAASGSQAISARITPASSVLFRLALKGVASAAESPARDETVGGSRERGEAGARREPEPLMVERLLKQMLALESLRPLFVPG